MSSPEEPLLRPQQREYTAFSSPNFYNVALNGAAFFLMFSVSLSVSARSRMNPSILTLARSARLRQAFNTAQSLLTSVLKEEHFDELGFYSLTIVYIFNGLILPVTPAIVARIGEKRSMLLSAVGFSIFLAALIVVHPVLIYITSVFVGLSSGVLWVAQVFLFLTFLIVSDSNELKSFFCFRASF